MVEVTRINDSKLAINPFQIEMMEETPDTVILFNSGRKIVVKEKVVDIKRLFEEFLAESVRIGIERARK